MNLLEAEEVDACTQALADTAQSTQVGRRQVREDVVEDVGEGAALEDPGGGGVLLV